MLPRIDAALQGRQPNAASAVVAHRVHGWSVSHADADHPVALSLRNDRVVDAAYVYVFALDAAVQLHRELGNAIALASGQHTPAAAAAALFN